MPWLTLTYLLSICSAAAFCAPDPSVQIANAFSGVAPSLHGKSEARALGLAAWRFEVLTLSIGPDTIRANGVATPLAAPSRGAM